MDAARALVDALGGGDNIVDIEPCSLRIRVEVASQVPVREDDLRIPCVLAVLRSGPVVQIIAGTDSDEIAGKMKEILRRGGVVRGAPLRSEDVANRTDISMLSSPPHS